MNAWDEIPKKKSQGTVVENPTGEVGECQAFNSVERTEVLKVLDQVEGRDPRLFAL